MSLRVVIVGAGIGGPAAAAALARNGHNVSICELSTTTTAVGYAFRITPNADRCLNHLGIDTIGGGAVSANTSRMLNENGKIIWENIENKKGGTGSKGTSMFAFRPQVAKQLMEAATNAGAHLITGKRVTHVDTNTTTITLDDNTTIKADLIIGADGVSSVVRSAVTNSNSYQPKSTTGHAAIRFMLPKSAIQETPALAALLKDECHFISWKSTFNFILVYPVDYGKQYNVTMTHPVSTQRAAEQELAHNISEQLAVDSERSALYDNAIPRALVQAIYRELPAEVQTLIDLAADDAFRVWTLKDLADLPTWSKNNTIIIGDAAHQVLPFGFSGAGMAIEDAVIIGELLPRDVDAKDVAKRIEFLKKSREERVVRVREHSRKMGKDEVGFEAIAEYIRFLGDYDAVEAGKQALKEVTS